MRNCFLTLWTKMGMGLRFGQTQKLQGYLKKIKKHKTLIKKSILKIKFICIEISALLKYLEPPGINTHKYKIILQKWNFKQNNPSYLALTVNYVVILRQSIAFHITC